jgi:hypothetical protein
MATKLLTSVGSSFLGLVALLGGPVGCGTGTDDELFTDLQEHTSYNGLSENGLGDNGLNSNGLNVNGLNVNGLNANGLSNNSSFRSWYASGSYHGQPQVMDYLAECALSGSQSTSYSGRTWGGHMGLATGWYSGAPSLASQRWVTACMMAHVNADGRRILVSFRGSAGGLSSGSTERSNYPKEEGAFFGNVMAGGAKKYACRGPYASYSASNYGRRCANNPSLCGFNDRGSCSSVCSTRNSDGSWTGCMGGDGTRYYNVVTAYVK